MGFLRHQSGNSITIDRHIEEMFNAVVAAGKKVGKVKDQSKIANYVVVVTPMRLFPPQNPATVRISLKKVNDAQTEISFASDSLDGAVGIGSAGKAIDHIIKTLETVL